MKDANKVQTKRSPNRMFIDKSNCVAEIRAVVRAVMLWFYKTALYDFSVNRVNDMDAARACRALDAFCEMYAMSDKPEKYFSRESTIAAWDTRAMMYARSKKSPIVNGYGAHNLVDTPADVAFKKAKPGLFNEKIANEYHDFCKLVMNWEYNRTSGNKQEFAASKVQAQEIVRIANNMFDDKKQKFFLRNAASFRSARAH